MSNSDDNKAANAHVAELLQTKTEREIAGLRSLGVIPPEPAVDHEGRDGGARPAEQIAIPPGDPEVEHNEFMNELVLQLKQQQAMGASGGWDSDD